MIETCAQIHRKLWYSNELAVAQGYGKNPRDEALLKSLAIKLSIPDESFILSDESKAISAQQYLMAMLEVLEPLSVMFQDIWNYCERSMTKTSKNTLDISWNFNIKGDQVTINFEAFRRYRQLLEQVPESNAFNNLCNGFADACRNYQENRPNERPAKLPAKPKGAMPKSVASRIYDLCESVRDQGLEKAATGGRLMQYPRYGPSRTYRSGICMPLHIYSHCWINVPPISRPKTSLTCHSGAIVGKSTSFGAWSLRYSCLRDADSSSIARRQVRHYLSWGKRS
ncbi:hypothetical protein RHM66_24330 [Pseudomonas sp. RTB3]|nr:hypothetical protein RHM66_24330 [Pseudomonas sp. RTB3]